SARAAPSASPTEERPLVTPCRHWPQKKEPREALSRGSALTGRSRSSVTVVEARHARLEPTTEGLTTSNKHQSCRRDLPFVVSINGIAARARAVSVSGICEE